MQKQLQKIRVKIKQNDSPAHFFVEYDADKPEFGEAQNHSLDCNSNKNESGPKRNTGKYYLLLHTTTKNISYKKMKFPIELIFFY